MVFQSQGRTYSEPAQPREPNSRPCGRPHRTQNSWPDNNITAHREKTDPNPSPTFTIPSPTRRMVLQTPPLSCRAQSKPLHQRRRTATSRRTRTPDLGRRCPRHFLADHRFSRRVYHAKSWLEARNVQPPLSLRRGRHGTARDPAVGSRAVHRHGN